MALNFEKYKHDAFELVHIVADELGTENRDQAARILRAVLHAIRDRLPAPDAIGFAAQLPLIWKGIYYDGFSAGGPVRIRHADEWVDFIRSKTELTTDLVDFPTDGHVITAFNAIIRALDFYMSPGQVDQMLNALPEEVCELLEAV